MKLGSIFTDAGARRWIVGQLSYDPSHHHACIYIELDGLLPPCRDAGTGTLKAACVPLPEVKNPPYLACDIQFCKRRDTRVKLGYVWTMDDAYGRAIYQVRFDVNAVLKQFGLVYLHCHETEVKE